MEGKRRKGVGRKGVKALIIVVIVVIGVESALEVAHLVPPLVRLVARHHLGHRCGVDRHSNLDCLRPLFDGGSRSRGCEEGGEGGSSRGRGLA